ncbi:MAG: DUF5071 domain-containing protein [Bacillus sp. (in: firmicutes)]
MNGVERRIQDLNWYKPAEVQQRAVKELSKIKGKDVILLARQSNELCDKACWHNAAIILKEIGYPDNREALPYVMEWFQDINWSGVEHIIELLKEIDLSISLPYMERAVLRAIRERDQEWAHGLLLLAHELRAIHLFESGLAAEWKALTDYDFEA